MSNLLFPKSAVLKAAMRAKQRIIEARKVEAIEYWNEIHQQGFISKLFRRTPKPIPPADAKWIDEQVKENLVYGLSLTTAEQFIAYCERDDAADTIVVDREDASRLNLI